MVIVELGEDIPADANVSKAGDKKTTDSKKPVSLETEEKASPQETGEEIDLEEIVAEEVGLQETVTEETVTEEAGQKTGEKAGEERDECAICFESGTNFVDLPCSCSIKYCSNCWDRALATSVTVRGRAQCPSCRSAFKVDFDSEHNRVMFSKDPEGTGACDWRVQLYDKVRHVQIQHLQAFGKNVAVSESSTVDTECGNSCGHGHCGHSCGHASSSKSAPHCVCGAELEWVSSRSRIMRLLEDMDPNWRQRDTNNMVERLLESSLVTCDLCDKVAIRSKGLWTCKNGPHTVMHPAAYDVCESCFEKYSGVSSQEFSGEKNETSARTKPRSVLCWESSRVGQTCCQACTAVLGALRGRARGNRSQIAL